MTLLIALSACTLLSPATAPPPHPPAAITVDTGDGECQATPLDTGDGEGAAHAVDTGDDDGQ